MKIVAGLGNPGPEYDATRHNVGWWIVDRAQRDWGFGPFRRRGALLVSEGVRNGADVLLAKPTAYMNRSGTALAPLIGAEEFRGSEDLLVAVDDATLEVGRVRFRPGGSHGGHNGLRSVEAAIGSGEFARLRVGVGVSPPGSDLAEWVLSAMGEQDEEAVVELLPELVEAIGLWVGEGIEATMSRYNR